MSSQSTKSDTELDLEPEKSNHDVEKGPEPTVQEQPQEQKDSYLVDLSDDENPMNWKMKTKWIVTVTVSLVTFISPATSSIAAPAAPVLAKDLNIESGSFMSQMTVSVFVLGYAFGPLILSPLSELFGRRYVMILTNLFFLVFNLGCGFAQNATQLIVCRLFAGLGGSAPQGVGSGILADIWSREQRGKAYSIYSLAPLLGPGLGPIAGGFIGENTTWRWAFWATTIADAFVAINLYFMLPETFVPTLVKRKVAQIKKKTGDDRYYSKYDDKGKSIWDILVINITRPFRFLATQPIIQFIAIYMAFLYGTFYILLTTFPTLWTESYGQSLGISGLNYIAISAGCMVAGQVGSRILDVMYRRLKAKNNGVGRPEYRVPMMIASSLLFPIGMFIYGWSGYYKTHWIVPDIGMAIGSFGVLITFTPLQVYLVDCFGQYAASAMAGSVFLRGMCGFALPLAAPKMYEQLGFGWGNSLLAFIAMALGIPFPIVLWYKGQSIRAKSKYAVKDEVSPPEPQTDK